MATIKLGYKPHQFQASIHKSRKRFKVVVAHRRFGKTVVSIMELIHRALKDPRPDARYYYISPFLKQSKAVAWDYLTKWAMMVPGTEKNESELTVTFMSGARIKLVGGDNADALRGIYIDGIVIDEVSDMKPTVWSEIIRPAMADQSRKGSWAMFIGTPKGINLLSQIYEQAAGDPEWDSFLFRVDETGLIDADELASARKTMSDGQYRQEFLCDWNAANDNVLITIDLVSEAAARGLHPNAMKHAARVMGVDVARFGDDRSVIQMRQGLAAAEPIVFSGMDNMALAGRVADLITSWQPDAVFIDGGRGEGVIDRLRQLGFAVVEVNFGGKPDNPRYLNKRTEMWDRAREWLVDGGSLPNNSELKGDLATPTYDFDAAQRMRLEPKEKIKERGLRSPDLGDALALTFAFHVSPTIRTSREVQTVSHDYDPYHDAA